MSVLAALDTAGQVWYSLSTIVETIRLFLAHLFEQLDSETPGWRLATVVLMDGARYHVAAETRSYLDGEGVTYMYTARNSPSSSPIEMLFALLKRGDMNPDKLPTGKR